LILLFKRKHTAYRKRVRPTRAKGLQVDEAVVLGKSETAIQTTQVKNKNTTEVNRTE
jgi:hypothetical protein